MAMEQQYQERRRGSDTCLVCGRRGGNTIVVTSVHSFVSASGTPLADFLVKVVGEDPCYSVSEVICQQCFVLLDRLDAYQARAAEIHTHVTSRYRDTKLELLGQRQRMSELIASSLSNVKELRHGTTLNVSDELTITVVHEALPKKRRKLSNLENGSALSHIYRKPSNIHGAANIYCAKNDSVSQYISKKIKRKRVPEASSDMCFLKDKKKLTIGGSVSVNNNNIAYANCVKSFVASKEGMEYEIGRTIKRKIKGVEVDIRNSSTDGELSDDTSKGNCEQKVVNEEEGEEEDEDEEEEGNYGDDDEDDHEEEEEGLEDREEPSETVENDDEEVEKEHDEDSSDDDSSSDSDEDVSASEQDEDDVRSETQSFSGVEKEQENNNEDDDEDEEEAISGEDQEPPFVKQEPSLSKTTQDQSLQQNTKPHNNPAQQSDTQNKIISKVEPTEQIHPQSDAGESVPPQIAEAMLIQSPLATSLLQSFLATSLWFSSPETSNKKKSSNQAKHKQQQVPDDVTSETLAVTAASTKDKKKRQELKNTGQSYVNTKGKLVDAKRVWPQDCSRCPLKCNARISEEERQKIFAEYWGLADYNLQREYLAAHMQREEKLGPSGLLRTVVLYFLTRGNNTKLQVCRQFFLKTLDVSEKASRIVLEKMVRGELGSEGGTATPPPGTARPHSSQEDHLSCKNGDEGHISNEDEDAKSEVSS